MNNLKNID